MQPLLVIAVVALLAAVVLFGAAWRISESDRRFFYSRRHVPYVCAALLSFLTAFLCGIFSLIDSSNARHARDARQLLIAAVQAEQQFRATHTTYGTLNVDLALADPNLVNRLGRRRRLTIELSADGKTAKITAQSGRVKVSRFIGQISR